MVSIAQLPAVLKVAKGASSLNVQLARKMFGECQNIWITQREEIIFVINLARLYGGIQ